MPIPKPRLRRNITPVFNQLFCQYTQNVSLKTNCMKRLYLWIGCLCCAFLASCGNLSEGEIKETTESGVVLIQNTSYYEVKLNNAGTLYFKGIDEEGDFVGIALERDSVEKNVSYGTGFFVAEDGLIATNAHVIADMVGEKQLSQSVNNVMGALKRLFAEAYNEKLEALREVERAYEIANYSDAVSYEQFYQIKNYRDALKQELNEYAEIYNGLDNVRPENAEINYHNEVSIAYNNTFVTKPEDFNPCVVIDYDKEHDLGLIQLKNKQTPEGKYIFEVPEEDPMENYSFMENITAKVSDDKNSKLCMIGYNLGPTLALTKEGVKSQINSGSISQQTKERLMYSIPSLPGSSGSPVLNMCGQLVAINYAGISTTQSFNYGVRVKYLRSLMDR